MLQIGIKVLKSEHIVGERMMSLCNYSKNTINLKDIRNSIDSIALMCVFSAGFSLFELQLKQAEASYTPANGFISIIKL